MICPTKISASFAEAFFSSDLDISSVSAFVSSKTSVKLFTSASISETVLFITSTLCSLTTLAIPIPIPSAAPTP